jgi:serine/threonine-protein kinase ULK4
MPPQAKQIPSRSPLDAVEVNLLPPSTAKQVPQVKPSTFGLQNPVQPAQQAVKHIFYPSGSGTPNTQEPEEEYDKASAPLVKLAAKVVQPNPSSVMAGGTI